MKTILYFILFLKAPLLMAQNQGFGSGADFELDGTVGNYDDGDLFGPDNADLGDSEGLDAATPNDSVNEVNPSNGYEGNYEYTNEAAPGLTTVANEEYENNQFSNSQYEQGTQNLNQQSTNQYSNGQYSNQQSTNGNNTYETGNYTNQIDPNATELLEQTPVGNSDVLLQQNSPSEYGSLPPLESVDGGSSIGGLPQEAETIQFSAPEQYLPDSEPLPPPNEFGGTPPLPGTLRNMADGEAPEEYSVEFGDTLFDVCDQLLDEPAYWPKLWSLNPEIKNPHFIWPGMKLAFYPGDDESPPYLQIVSEEDVIPIDRGELVTQELLDEPVDVVDQLDDDGFTEVIGPEDLAIADDIFSIFEFVGTYPSNVAATVTVPGFIYKQERTPLARVIFGREGEELARPEQLVFVKKERALEMGGTYTILRPGGEVENPVTGDEIGQLYYFVAHVRVDRDLKDGVTVVEVRESLRGVKPEDIVVEYISTKRLLASTEAVGTLASVKGTVVSMADPDQLVSGAGELIFIEGGAPRGLQKDMFVPLYGKAGFVQLPFAVGELPEDWREIGVARIIDATDAGAVAFIVRSEREIRIGDRVDKG